MITAIISDNQTQLKRFKGRGKYELYIHNRGFREKVKASGLLCPDETLEFNIAIKKSLVSKNIKYLKMIQKYLDFLELKGAVSNPEDSLHSELRRHASDIRKKFSEFEQISPENRDLILGQAWKEFRALSGF